MTGARRLLALKRQQDMGMVAMGPEGRYQLTPEGRDFLDDLQLLLELDDRGGTAQESSPWRSARPARSAAAAATSEGQRAGDDGRPEARRSRRKRT